MQLILFGQIFNFHLSLQINKERFVYILHSYPLVRPEVEDWDVLKRPKFSSKLKILWTDHIEFLIFLIDLVNYTPIDWILKGMLASNGFILFCFFPHQFILISKQLQLLQDAGSDSESDPACNNILKLSLQVDSLFNQEFDEITIQKQLIRIMKSKVDPKEVNNLIDLLIIHRK